MKKIISFTLFNIIFYGLYASFPVDEAFLNINYEEKKFKDELIKLQIQTNNEKFIFEHDEYLRNNINLDDLENILLICLLKKCVKKN